MLLYKFEARQSSDRCSFRILIEKVSDDAEELIKELKENHKYFETQDEARAVLLNELGSEVEAARKQADALEEHIRELQTLLKEVT